MEDSIRARCVAIGAYMLANDATVRQAARAFGLSKSSVHKDVGRRLPLVEPALALRVAELMAHNKAVCHLRGGEATRRRYAARMALQSRP